MCTEHLVKKISNSLRELVKAGNLGTFAVNIVPEAIAFQHLNPSRKVANEASACGRDIKNENYQPQQCQNKPIVR